MHIGNFSRPGFVALRKCRRGFAYLFSVALLFCNDPFFPPTGEPPVISSQRSTPQGVLRQLINAYETQRIDLYMDLFSASHDFRFYVSPVFATDPKGYQIHFGARPCEPVDSVCLYVKKNIHDSCFYYWTYDEEMRSAEHLFAQATQITFLSSPTYADAIRYIVNGAGETTNVEVVMRGGTIDVQGVAYPCDTATPNQLCADEFPIDIADQVFYLERDPASPNLWVIFKWFDLGTATGN